MDALKVNDPTVLGRYVLQARLGAGGMGQVYLGRSPGGRLVALKVIRDGITEHPEALPRFRREVDTARAVRSAYTANLIDASLDEAPYWLATEYVEGPTLAAAVAARGPLPGRTCRGLFAALAEGLAAVHACGVTHRDLKPQNVILSRRGPQLIDFGIARGVEQTAVTETGASGPGTPGFTAPEVLLHNEVGPAADVFALGATVAFAATGRPPFGAGSAAGVAFRAVYEEIDVEGVEEDLAQLVRDCVAKDPAARPGLERVIERCAVAGALVGDAHYAALTADTGSPPVALTAGTGPVPGAVAGAAPVATPPMPVSAPPAAPYDLPTADGYTPTQLTRPGAAARRRRAWTVAGAVVLAAAVTGGVLLALPDGGEDGDDRKERAAGTAEPTRGASASPAKGNDEGPQPPRYIEQTAPNVVFWEADPGDWSGGECNLTTEEVSQSFQWSVPRSQEEVSTGKIDIAMRLDGKRPPEGRYHVSAVVKPPHDVPAKEAAESGLGLMENRSLGFASKPVDLSGPGGTEWVKFTYPDDFALHVDGKKRGTALPLRDDPGQWTVMFMHVEAPKKYASVACDGFTVPE